MHILTSKTFIKSKFQPPGGEAIKGTHPDLFEKETLMAAIRTPFVRFMRTATIK